MTAASAVAAAAAACHRGAAQSLRRRALTGKVSSHNAALTGRGLRPLATAGWSRRLHDRRRWNAAAPSPTARPVAAAAAAARDPSFLRRNESGGAVAETTPDEDPSLDGFDLSHPDCNVTSNIASRVGRNLHLRPGHPLHTVKSVIYDYWKSLPGSRFAIHDEFSPVVPTLANFDSLLIPPDHVSRAKSDTYYLDGDTVLRTHTSAHQTTLLERGEDQFLVTGDVYRRDEIDASHYPVFHQMEGVRMFTDAELADAGAVAPRDGRALAESDLKSGLEGMARALFGDVEMRWVDEYFPFTDPSYELEIHFGGEWMEVLGCGVVHRDIVRNVGRGSQPGWAFGLGLERLAMVLFSIPDIRLFWSDDERFHSQFEGSGIDVTFQPYSKYPACYKDISFWTTTMTPSPVEVDEAEVEAEAFHENDFFEIVRDVGGDLVEKVELIDEFAHPKSKRVSNCFRISYRSMDRSLTNEEIDVLQERVRAEAVEKLGVELR